MMVSLLDVTQTFWIVIYHFGFCDLILTLIRYSSPQEKQTKKPIFSFFPPHPRRRGVVRLEPGSRRECAEGHCHHRGHGRGRDCGYARGGGDRAVRIGVKSLWLSHRRARAA